MSPNNTSETQLSALPLFHDLDPLIIKTLLSAASLSRYDKGEILQRADEPILRISLLLEGWACVRKGNADGQEAVLHILSAGDLFPESTSTDIISEPDAQPSYSANIEALTPVTMLNLPFSVVKDTSQRSPRFTLNILRQANATTRKLLDHIEQLTLHDAEQRVGWFLLNMRADTRSDGTNIDLPFEKSVIASYLGIKPETLSRVLQSFKQQGIIIKRNKIILPDLHALCAYCDSEIARECEHIDKGPCPFLEASKLKAV